MISEVLVERAAVPHKGAGESHVTHEPSLGVGELSAVLRPARAFSPQADDQGGRLLFCFVQEEAQRMKQPRPDKVSGSEPDRSALLAHYLVVQKRSTASW